jgi:hypothetical protein
MSICSSWFSVPFALSQHILSPEALALNEIKLNEWTW